MRANKLFKRPKAKDGEGRQVKIKHILVPEELADALELCKIAYELCLGLKRVTYEQMLRRWLDNVGRIDPDVPGFFKEAARVRQIKKEYREKIVADLDLTPEQLEENERNSDPTEGEVWKQKYFFKKDGEELEAIPGDQAVFYAKYEGRNIGMSAMLNNGWKLINEIGNELTWSQAFKINRLIKEHKK